MKHQITLDIPIPPPSPYATQIRRNRGIPENATPETLTLRETLRACPVGGSFVVLTLREARYASIAAKRMRKKTTFRKQLDGSRRVWVIA